MSVLRIVRNLAVLLILAMAFFSSASRSAGNKKAECLSGTLCDPRHPCPEGCACTFVGFRSVCSPILKKNGKP